jgi:hypothetical protein
MGNGAAVSGAAVIGCGGAGTAGRGTSGGRNGGVFSSDNQEFSFVIAGEFHSLEMMLETYRVSLIVDA